MESALETVIKNYPNEIQTENNKQTQKTSVSIESESVSAKSVVPSPETPFKTIESNLSSVASDSKSLKSKTVKSVKKPAEIIPKSDSESSSKIVKKKKVQQKDSNVKKPDEQASPPLSDSANKTKVPKNDKQVVAENLDDEGTEIETEVTETEYSATEDDVESLADHETVHTPRHSVTDSVALEPFKDQSKTKVTITQQKQDQKKVYYYVDTC